VVIGWKSQQARMSAIDRTRQASRRTNINTVEFMVDSYYNLRELFLTFMNFLVGQATLRG